MPKTAAQFGINPFDLAQSAAAATKYIGQLLKMFSGDMEAAVAAYNWGPGHVRRDIRQHGANWEQYLPAETKGYVEKVLHIKLVNQTGASPVMSAAALGQQ
jgi:soluble lytic murein transglycosylase-like protein